MTAAPRMPGATYRLQLNREFTLRDAERLVDYLARLGITHIYASSLLRARPGSTHGYDITDYGALNPEIGDDEAFAALTAALHERDMGLIVDFVPNHMGVARSDNPWWLDVLEWGRASPYADYFDIDWYPAKRELRGKVLLPFLGDHYGKVLEGGELEPKFDPDAGSFGVWYHDHLFPVSPSDYGRILAPAAAEAREGGRGGEEACRAVSEIVEHARALKPTARSARRRAAAHEHGLELKKQIARAAQDPAVDAIVRTALARLSGTPGEPRSFLALHRLLERQAYRLAYWRVAADEINYRRFFDINDLAGVRVEREDLFRTAHALLLRWIAQSRVDGVRIDHIDGLFDPARYCRRLAAAMEAACCKTTAPEDPLPPSARRDPHRAPPVYFIVEKILARAESLRDDWPIHGTTGYDALNLLNGLFVRPEGERTLSRVYRRFTDRTESFDEVLYRSRKHILKHALASELQVLANQIDRICERNWHTRDFTLASLRAALEEVAACFPAYRTYVDAAGAKPEDRQDIDWAIAAARRRSPDRETSVFDFVHDVLTTDLVRRRRAGFSQRQVIDFAMRFQQFTGPVTAKALEDTSFYRYARLISLNEVGGDPRRFGTTLSAFHHLTRQRLSHWPLAMVATSTHDAKRGEDARLRIDVLSEIPAHWARQVDRWARFNRSARRQVDGAFLPTRNDEYFLYQTLLGSWPPDLFDAEAMRPESLDRYRLRIEGCMVKAVREAKLHSNWASPDEEYEGALRSFVGRILDPVRSRKFLADFAGFAREQAWYGVLNSLSQTLLKLTVPGVCDFYQGSELWDLNMVDPDNRRPVDFPARARMLASLENEDAMQPAFLRGLLESWPDGRVKLFVIRRLLRLRREYPALFAEGDYLPLEAEGEGADHVCAFARRRGDAVLVVVAPRFYHSLAGQDWPPAKGTWADTRVRFPEGMASLAWRDVLAGTPVGLPMLKDDGLDLASALAGFPVCVLFAG